MGLGPRPKLPFTPRSPHGDPTAGAERDLVFIRFSCPEDVDLSYAPVACAFKVGLVLYSLRAIMLVGVEKEAR